MPDHENLLVPWDACSRRYVVNVGPLDFAGNGGTLPHTRLSASLKADAKDDGTYLTKCMRSFAVVTARKQRARVAL
jgi:hypothetical protein